MTNKTLHLLLILISLTSCKVESAIKTPAGFECDDYTYYHGVRYCYSESYLYMKECDNIKRSAFIIDCAKAANPMSDEEGEDLVKQCEETSINLFCKKIFKNDR